MPRRRSKIACPKCSDLGGGLTPRNAGNAINKKYFYIKHFSRSIKHKNESCYIGRPGMLTYVTLLDKRYDSDYETLIRYTNTQHFKALNNEERMDVIRKILGLLLDMGFPKKYVEHKYVADTAHAFLRNEFERLRKTGTVDLEQFNYNDELNWRVEKRLGELNLTLP